MKPTFVPLLALAAFALTASSAQTPVRTPVRTPAKTPAKAAHRTEPRIPSHTAYHAASRTAPRESLRGCAKLPVLSPKIPALPADLPCARPLYTIATIPSARIVSSSPMEGRELRDTLGLEPTTFSLDYIDTRIGAGALAAPNQWYTVKYTGYLTNGVKFDSSDDHPGKAPFTFQYGKHQVIIGWDTGLDGMRVGGKRRLFIPWQLAYGPTPHGPIPAKSELVFDIELLAQSDHAPAPKATPVAASHEPIEGRRSPAESHTATAVTLHPESHTTEPAPHAEPTPHAEPAPQTAAKP